MGLCSRVVSTCCGMLAAFAILGSQGVDGAVLGIDLGNEFFKVAMVAPGRPFEIVLNAHSKRKTPSAVSFAEKTRAFGDDALSHSVRAGSKVFMHLPSMLAYNATGLERIEDLESADPNFFPPRRYFPYDYQLDESRGSLKIRIDDHNTAYPEEILAHIFSYIKRMVEDSYAVDAAYCVLTAPSSFSMRQREALRDAATIGGLKVVAIVQENSAAALQHALDLKFTVDPVIVSTDEAESATGGTDASTDTTTQAPSEDGGSTATTTTTTTKKKTTTTTTAPPALAPPQLKVILNVGSTEIQACVVRYSGFRPSRLSAITRSVHVLGCTSARGGLSGHAVDIALADYMARSFVEQHPKAARTDNWWDLPARTMKKLLRQAVKTKHVLSANKEARFSIESLMNDQDFSETVSRNNLEKLLTAPFAATASAEGDADPRDVVLQHIRAPIEDAIRAANVTNPLSEFEGIEVIGGGWRVPIVQDALDGWLKSETNDQIKLGQRLNADEAMAFGAAYVAANHSNIFRVLPIHFTDSSNYSYKVGVRPLNPNDKEPSSSFWGGSAEMFPGDDGHDREIIGVGSRMNGNRTLTFKANRDLAVRLYEEEDVLAEYHVVGLAELREERKTLEAEAEAEAKQKGAKAEDAAMEKKRTEETSAPAKVTLTFRISPWGTVELGGAHANFKKTKVVTQPPPTPPPTTTTTTTSTTTSTIAAEGNTTAEETTTPTTTTPTTTTTTTPPAVYLKSSASATKKMIVTVASLGLPLPLTSEQISESVARLKKADDADKQIRLQETARNTLESYIYASRSKLSNDEEIAVSAEEEREKLLATLSETEDWLYGDGFDASLAQLTEKHRGLEASAEPIFLRASEYKQRPKMASLFQATIENSRNAIVDLRAKNEWLTQEQADAVEKVIFEVEEWYKLKTEKQAATPLTDPPAYIAREVNDQLEKVVSAVEKFSKIERPKTTTPAPPPASESGEEKDNSETVSENAGAENGQSEATTTPAAEEDEASSTHNKGEEL